MRQAWRVADVRAAEHALMERVPAGSLMQRAAAGLARRAAVLLAERYGGVYGRRVVLLVGGGNNGGDTLYAGARLAGRGATVSAVLLAPDRVHEGGLAALRAAGGTAAPYRAGGAGHGDGDHEPPGGAVAPRAAGGTVDLVLDGITGIGGTGGLREDASRAFAAVCAATAVDGDRPAVIAVDVPSGVDVDTGDVPGAAVSADVTVTFGCLKPGLVVGAGAPRAGLVELVDIGLRPYLTGRPAVRVPDAGDVAGWWPRPGPDSDKYRRGVVGLVTGSDTYSGAAILSVAGAQAGPAGMVRYTGSAGRYVRAAHPAAIVTDRVADAGRVQAWVCGSGLGTDERAAAELEQVLRMPVPVCVDADALTLLAGGAGDADGAGGGGPLLELFGSRQAESVVTPHDGEFERLAGAPPGADRVAAATALAARINATVLLKGDRTVVATPSGQVYANPTGSAYLATAGTGDVLAGLLGSLLAAGLPAPRAAVAAAYVHGLAGRHAARSGPVTAERVAAALVPVLADLLGAGG